MGYHVVAFFQNELMFKPFEGGQSLADAILHNLSELGDGVERVTLVGHPTTAAQVTAAAAKCSFAQVQTITEDQKIERESIAYPLFIKQWMQRPDPLPTMILDPGATFLDPDMVRAGDQVLKDRKLLIVVCSAVRGWDVHLISSNRPAVSNFLERVWNAVETSGTIRILPSAGPSECDGLTQQYSAKIPGWSVQLYKTIQLSLNPFSWTFYSSLLRILKGPLHSLRPGVLFQTFTQHREELQNWPSQIEIELATASAVVPVYSPLHALAGEIQKRGPYMDPALFDAILDRIERGVDPSTELIFNCVTGDPLEHPNMSALFKSLAARLPFGALRSVVFYTYGHAFSASLTGDFIAFCKAMRLKRNTVQMIVRLDAANAEVYSKIKRGVSYESVMENMARLLAARKEYYAETGQTVFVLAVATTLLEETQDHMDDFMKAWPSQAAFQKKIVRQNKELLTTPEGRERYEAMIKQFYRDQNPVEHSVIYGPSHFAAQIPVRPVADYTPLKRMPCRRLNEAVTILCDGTVVMCDRVLAPTPPLAIGSLLEYETFSDVWRSGKLKSLRDGHRRGAANDLPLCGKCADWYIPL